MNQNTKSGEQAQRIGVLMLKLDVKLTEVYNIIFQSRNLNKKDKFYYTIFAKIKFLLEAVQIQVYNLDRKPQFTAAIILSLRTAMLDILNLFYVMDAEGDEEKIDSRINQIMNDHLQYMYEGFSKEDKDDIRSDFPEHFDEDGKLKKPGKLTAKRIQGEIREFSSLVPLSSDALFFYDVFSKFEHNGVFTFDILHNSFLPGAKDIIRSYIYKAISIGAYGCWYIASNWPEVQVELKNEFARVIEELLEAN